MEFIFEMVGKKIKKTPGRLQAHFGSSPARTVPYGFKPVSRSKTTIREDGKPKTSCKALMHARWTRFQFLNRYDQNEVLQKVNVEPLHGFNSSIGTIKTRGWDYDEMTRGTEFQFLNRYDQNGQPPRTYTARTAFQFLNRYDQNKTAALPFFKAHRSFNSSIGTIKTLGVSIPTIRRNMFQFLNRYDQN